MQNQPNISPENLSKLVQMAASKLGTTPDYLMSSLQSGQLENVIQDKKAAQNLKDMMADPNKAQSALNNAGMQEMLKNFMK